MNKDRAQTDKEELAKKTANFRALQQISSVMNASLDVDEIYTVVLHTLDKLFDFHHAIILLLDESGDTLEVVASHGYDDQPTGGKVPVGAGVIGVVAKRRRIMRVGNLGQKRAYASAVRREMQKSSKGDEVGEAVPVPGLTDAESQIAIPLEVREDLIGVCSVESRSRTSFTEHDEDLVAIVAHQAASAIHNARLFQSVEQRSRELAEAHERLQKLNETLEQRVYERTAELEQANRELHEAQARLVQSGKMAALGGLVAGIAHEINTPIGAIYATQDNLKRALQKLKDNLEADQLESNRMLKKTVDTIEAANHVIGSGARRVADIVGRLRSFAKLDEAELQRADIHECIDDTLVLLQHELKDGVAVVKEYGDIPPVVCYPGRLNQVFLNLLHNAAQAIEGDGQITVSTRRVGEDVVVAVKDTGTGISTENLAKVFDPGYTTKGVGVGTGLGLSICYQIMQDHKGRIEADSELAKGSTFTVVLPVNMDSPTS